MKARRYSIKAICQTNPHAVLNNITRGKSNVRAMRCEAKYTSASPKKLCMNEMCLHFQKEEKRTGIQPTNGG